MYLEKKFGVFGLGISGLSTIKYLQSKSANFIAFDDKLSLNETYFKNLADRAWQQIDYLILSPGIPPSHPIVAMAKEAKAKIICDIELFYLDNPDARYIGITGTNGKSTTSALVAHILKYNGIKALLAGNIGIPILDLPHCDSNSMIVIEVSSFQLDLLDLTRFNIALLLNITPDHLDRYGDMEHYRAAKYRIFANQTIKDSAIINLELEHRADMMTFSVNRNANLTIIDDLLIYNSENYTLPHNNSLLGVHNQQNIAAASAVCVKAGLELEQIITALPSFVGLKHRMQFARESHGIIFINDSKATNADSTAKALACFDNIIWIVGGIAKAGGISSLKEYFPKIKQALLIGSSQDEFALTLEDAVIWQKCGSLEKAFKIALEIAKAGDVVMLSPACASYDQWKNFEERGDEFIKLTEF